VQPLSTLALVGVAISLALAGCASRGTPAAAPASQTPTVTQSVAPTTTSARAAPATRRIVVRPVTAAGGAAPGFTVVTQTALGTAMCSPTTGPGVSVDGSTYTCYPTALGAVACWRDATPGFVICDVDPYQRRLTRYPASFAASSPAATWTVPFGITLDTGQRCLVRDGGAWSTPVSHPGWVGWYSCGTGHTQVVYAPQTRTRTFGIDQSQAAWQVLVGSADGTGSLVRHRVSAAYYVGLSR
jgi:hypothetical protein